jgi:hypothetical protein
MDGDGMEDRQVNGEGQGYLGIPLCGRAWEDRIV